MTESTLQAETAQTSRLGRVVTGLPMLLILLVTLLAATGETLHSRMLEHGGATWPDYFRLRTIDLIQPPSCQPVQDIEAAVESEYQRKLAQQADDPFGDVFDGGADRDIIRESIASTSAQCEDNINEYNRVKAQDSWEVQAYARVEMLLSHLVTSVTSNRRVLLGLMILFCSAAATMRRLHISLRPVSTYRDALMSTVAQVASNAVLTWSFWLYRSQEYALAAQGMEVPKLFMYDIFVAGFGALTLIATYQLFRPAQYTEKGEWKNTPLAIPLYCYMCITAAFQFATYGFYHGIAVYMNMMVEMSGLFLNLGLYVWVGMLLARMHFAQKVFNIIRVWRLPPKWMGVVVLLLTAPPTAYSGASGIFIIAAGMTLYRELRRVGQSEQLALATTAISGSMGTMLRPCLLVLIVATLNNSVTTDELYSAGARVLLLTISLYTLFVFLLGGKSEGKMAPLSEAIPGTLKAFVPVLPYVGIFAAVVLAWQHLLGKGLDEFSAPAILPIAMLLMLAYERIILKSPDPDEDEKGAAECKTTGQAIIRATDESTALIGALLILMALSVSTGGLIERSGFLELFPETFSSPWIAITLLAGMLLFVGMIMDPYGAAILVNATLAPIAAQNGIDPLHFWVLTMLAFETGYLTPPVALNHLLTRQVIGPPNEWESLHGTFWQRYFRIIFPIIVMGTALIIMTYLPMVWPGIFR